MTITETSSGALLTIALIPKDARPEGMSVALQSRLARAELLLLGQLELAPFAMAMPNLPVAWLDDTELTDRLVSQAHAEERIVALVRDPWSSWSDVHAACQRQGIRFELMWGATPPPPLTSKLPLSGRTILLTRPKQQSLQLSQQITDLGGTALCLPTIDIEPLEPAEKLRQLDDLKRNAYDYLVFTSANAVDRFFELLEAAELDSRTIGDCKVCCIGPATARSLAAHGLRADITATEHIAEGLLAELEKHPLEGKRLLFPRADSARALLPRQLEKRGATVELMVVYRTLTATGGSALELAKRLLDARGIDAVVFTSASTANKYAELIGPNAAKSAPPTVAAIGPITAQACRDHGIRVTLMPDTHTTEALVAELTRHYARARS
ncbi:MAG: uroporphyrinogen-III synthase [Deltaproteobacteria bacterium]|nr:uroporphyrinogen-III synthase [Deltaproteobacteria bacterium]